MPSLWQELPSLSSWFYLVASHCAGMSADRGEGSMSAAMRRYLLLRCSQGGRRGRTPGLCPEPWQGVGEKSGAVALDFSRPASVSARQPRSLKWPLRAHARQACPSLSLGGCILCQMSPVSCSRYHHNTHFKAANCIPHDINGTVAEQWGRGWPDANGIESQGLGADSHFPTLSTAHGDLLRDFHSSSHAEFLFP